MTKNIDAIYENGAFRPLVTNDFALKDGARVRLTVEQVEVDTGENVLDLAAKVYAGLAEGDVVEIEEIAMDRTHFFSD